MLAILPIILQFLPYLVKASESVPQLIEFIAKLRAIFARDKSWTPEQEAAFDASIEELRNDPAFKVTD